MPGISLRLDPISASLLVGLKGITDPAERSRLLADTARVAIADAAAKNRAALGREPKYQVFVDQREGASLDTVKPDGVIVAEFELVDGVLAWIGSELVKHSPVGEQSDRRPGHPGLYQGSHVLLADGQEVKPGESLPRADEYAFLSTVPYARKIERGLSSQAPDGVYEVVAALASRRFGNIARIRFGFRAPLFGGVNAWANSPSAGRLAKRVRGGNPAGHAEWLRRQPAVIITPR